MKLLNRYLQQNEKNEQNKSKVDGQVHHFVNYKIGLVPFEAFIRVRPLFLPEQMKNPNLSIEVLDRESVIFKHEHQQGLKSLTKDKLYRCKRTVPIGGKTNSIFQLGILDLINDTFDGLNQAIFVIGGKDSGKTHTCIGNIVDPGFCFTIPGTIFQLRNKYHEQAKIYFSCFSFQNQFKDLLVYTGEGLEHKSTINGAYLPGLSQVECPDMLTYLTMLKTALIVNGKRDINRDYSQTYTLFNTSPEKEIFILKFTIVNQIEEMTENGVVFKETCADLYIIDTESYESMDKIDSKGVNNAMLSFNNCLRTVYEINNGMREDHFVHYEQSPFTSFFKDYLGGKSKTYIIGTVSPYVGHLEYSMRTVREVQWANKSKSNAIKQQDMRIGKSALASEVGYLKVMYNNSVLIHQEITILLKKNLVEEEEKQKYIQFLGKIFKKFYYINRICNEKVKKIIELRDQVSEINQTIVELEKTVMKDQLKLPDIKEFFLVKIVPLMYNAIYSQTSKAQQNLIKRLRTLKGDCAIIYQIKKDLREYIETHIKKNPQIKTKHQETISSFSKTIFDHINWSLYNCLKSFNHPDKEKFKEYKIKVEKTLETNFKRIFTCLNVHDYDKFEDRAFDYVGIRLMDMEKRHENRRYSSYQNQNIPRVPSLHSLQRERYQNSSNSRSSIRNIEEYYQDHYQPSITGGKKQFSSIFDLPPTQVIINMSGKNKENGQKQKYQFNSKSDNSLEERDSDNEEDSEEDEYEIVDNQMTKQIKYKSLRKVSKQIISNSKIFRKSLRQYSQQELKQLKTEGGGNGGYYDDEDISQMYKKEIKKKQKSKDKQQQQTRITRLNPPLISIQENRANVTIQRKLSVSPNYKNLIGNFMSGSSALPYITTSPYSRKKIISYQTSEIPYSHGQTNFTSQYTETLPTKTSKIQGLNTEGPFILNEKELDLYKDDANLFAVPKFDDQTKDDEVKVQVSVANFDQLTDDDVNEQNSLLNAINTQSIKYYTTDMRSNSPLASPRQYLPTVQTQPSEGIEEKDLLQFKSEKFYYQDISLKSKFNDKIVININLFKNDLDKFKIPVSIKQIFNQEQRNNNNNKTQNRLNTDIQHYSSPQQMGVLYNLNTRQRAKFPPKNSTFHRQMQLTTLKNNESTPAQIQCQSTKANSSEKRFYNKSIYYDSLEALVKNAGLQTKRYSSVDKLFKRPDEGPLLFTKTAEMKQKIFMKRQNNQNKNYSLFAHNTNNTNKLQKGILQTVQDLQLPA